MNPPFHRSYWAIPGKLLAGCYPGDLKPADMDAKLNALIDADVTLVVNLMEKTETDHSGNPFKCYESRLTALAEALRKQIRMERFAIRDQSVPTPDSMHRILESINVEISHGGMVYVHCWGGKGRTATVVGCYLISQSKETSDSVLATIQSLTAHAKEAFWPTPQTDEQCKFITSWRTTHA